MMTTWNRILEVPVMSGHRCEIPEPTYTARELLSRMAQFSVNKINNRNNGKQSS